MAMDYVVPRRGLCRQRKSCIFIKGLDRTDKVAVYHRCGPSVQPKLHGLRGRETQINVRSLPSVSESQRRRNATQSVIAQQNAAATQQGAASAASTAAWASVMQASRPLSVTYLHNGI